MEEMKVQLEKLRTEATNSALISQETTDGRPRDLFAEMSKQLDGLANIIEQAIVARSASH